MFKKVLFSLVGAIILFIAGTIIYLFAGYPDVGSPPEISVEASPSQIERGKYLANHVAICIDCHSTRNWEKFSGPPIPGTEGRGGDIFDHKMGFPGVFVARNITPYNLRDWTDGEIYRTITTGVTRDGSPLFPVMPYLYYRKMDSRDVKSIIAYIRTLEPIEHNTAPSDPDFPINLVMRTMPQPADPMNKPAAGDTLAKGKYLTTIAGCMECHTPKVQGQPNMDLFLAGGFEFELPMGTVRSANITPDDKTGIGTWSSEQFVNRFKQYEMPLDSVPHYSEVGYQTVMPWVMYAGMNEEDLKAIFVYLKTVEPIEHAVVRFENSATAAASR